MAQKRHFIVSIALCQVLWFRVPMATSIFVRGFDFGTTEGDIERHCSQAGAIVGLEMWGKGAAVVTFSSPQEAQGAVKLLHQSTIGSNTRYIDVKMNNEPRAPKGGSKGGGGKFAGFKRGPAHFFPGPCRVFCKGFDFGTTDEQLESHMSAAGQIATIQWATKGDAIVTYTTPGEARSAARTLHKTTIPGNTRFLDVILGEDEEEAFDDHPAAKRARMAVGSEKGGWVWIPPATGKGSKGDFKGGSKGKSKGFKGREDPAGSGRVFVRGFDFDTSDDQFFNYMKTAGPIHDIHWVSKGSAVVVYKHRNSADKAVNTLNGTTLPGHGRYMDVYMRDSE
eukprot:TRINITY_DN11510_c0_g1_i1.p2 TRINITY_DN11510_c0_g1~~TRINITY_DN11510_c0_g1_i1.p2  ORF type:complete len:337 (-),score=74.58 TRINITY_DN11510_c0_g1_i1:323-1333(-)